MSWFDISIYENGWEILESIAYGLPLSLAMFGGIFYFVKKTSYEV
jgi:hypothetical protein